MCTFDSARPSRQIGTRCSSSRKGPKGRRLVRSLPPRKITRNDNTHLSPHIRNSGGNNQQKAHIKVKISKAIIYQHEASKHWRSGELLQGRRLSKHYSCERNSWLDCMAYLFELRRNEGKWENLFRILYFHAGQHDMKSTMNVR
jgi:hypothetical protein